MAGWRGLGELMQESGTKVKSNVRQRPVAFETEVHVHTEHDANEATTCRLERQRCASSI